MLTSESQRSVSTYLLMASLLLQGLSGIAGGIGLLMDPSGESLGIPLAWLAGSPFPDYTIPAIFLVVVLGVFPLIVLAGVWTGQAWGKMGSILVGLALLIWLGVEILVIGYQPSPPLQLIYGALGAVILVLALLE